MNPCAQGQHVDNGYGSGISINTLSQSSSWGSQEMEWHQQVPPQKPRAATQAQNRLSSSFLDLVTRKSSVEDVMQEFRMNGSDSPYNPCDDDVWTPKPDGLAGMGPANIYLRQKSWPAPELTPSVPLPPSGPWRAASGASASLYNNTARYDTAMLEKMPEPMCTSTPTPYDPKEQLTEEQRRVLASLPGDVVLALLRDLERARAPPRRRPPPADECRFCKNNGERESYYRSHSLRDRGGRVACPVLRAFVCGRCGARGPSAHTAKYCPLASADERMKAAAVMRSMRSSSARRSHPSTATGRAHYVRFGDTPPAVLLDSRASCGAAHLDLDPLWAQLEAKLML